MRAFSYLEEDGIVQKTGYGNALSVIVNFGDTPHQFCFDNRSRSKYSLDT